MSEEHEGRPNCWDVMRCGREPGGRLSATAGPCPAAVDRSLAGVNGGVRGGRVCWTIAGTFCEGQVQGTFAGKLSTCLSCRFYRLVRRQEGDEFRHAPEGSIGPEDAEQLASAYARLNDLFEELATSRGQLTHAQRLRELGQLTTGVAHELNNPLTFVLHSLEQIVRALRSRTDLSAEQVQELGARAEEALWGTRRIGDIVKGLSSFGAAGPPEYVSLRLEEAVRGAVTVCANEVRHRARLVVDLGPVPPVMGHPGELSQVLVNLLTNAARAIDGPSVGNEVSIRTLSSGDEAVVEVSDTGRGIEPDHVPRLFEPFFTTAEHREGTGLGLPISRAIVEAHGGRIEVESRVGEGSCFRVVLPSAGEEPHEERSDARPSQEYAGPPRSILAVDDERIIGEMIRRLVGDRHRVELATSAVEARALIEKTDFDLLLFDLMMPGVSGHDLYEWLESARPELVPRVAFMTGGAFTPRVRAFLPGVGAPLLSKPFGADDLNALVRRMLERRGAEPGGDPAG